VRKRRVLSLAGGELTLNTLAYVGYILVLIGGILLAIFGVLDLLGALVLPFSLLGGLAATARGLISIVIGIICIIGARYVNTLIWGIILLVLGIVATGIGGTLVVLGALLGLISTLIKTAHK
jgi:hypothetical protein